MKKENHIYTYIFIPNNIKSCRYLSHIQIQKIINNKKKKLYLSIHQMFHMAKHGFQETIVRKLSAVPRARSGTAKRMHRVPGAHDPVVVSPGLIAFILILLFINSDDIHL